MIARADEDPEHRAAMRRAVVEAAERGLRPKPRRRRPKWQHEPNPAFDLTAAVGGSCRRVAELVEQNGPERILDGCIDEAMRRRTIAALNACQEAVAAILRHPAAQGDDA